MAYEKDDKKPLEGVTEIDYKDAEMLRKFMTDRGKILPRRYNGISSRQQRQIKRAIRQARVMGFLR
ncbi:MAG: 30S ribosomal protein S18 [Kiritimatiellales bacterium]